MPVISLILILIFILYSTLSSWQKDVTLAHRKTILFLDKKKLEGKEEFNRSRAYCHSLNKNPSSSHLTHSITLGLLKKYPDIWIPVVKKACYLAYSQLYEDSFSDYQMLLDSVLKQIISSKEESFYHIKFQTSKENEVFRWMLKGYGSLGIPFKKIVNTSKECYQIDLSTAHPYLLRGFLGDSITDRFLKIIQECQFETNLKIKKQLYNQAKDLVEKKLQGSSLQDWIYCDFKDQE